MCQWKVHNNCVFILTYTPELTTGGYYGMYLTALIIDCAIASEKGSVKLFPINTELPQENKFGEDRHKRCKVL